MKISLLLTGLLGMGGVATLLAALSRKQPHQRSNGSKPSVISSDAAQTTVPVPEKIATAIKETGQALTGKEPRGIRNNNPLNIEFNQQNNWQGQTGTDGRFATFNQPAYGVRAGAKLIKRYMDHYQLRTIDSIVHRWAPPSENESDVYGQFVARRSGININTPLTEAHIPAIIEAMIAFENGKQPYGMGDIRQWSALA